MSYSGIDYGLGQTNRDANGVSFGTINANSLPGWIWDNFEPVYPEYSDVDLASDASTELGVDVRVDDDDLFVVEYESGEEEFDRSDLIDHLTCKGWSDPTEFCEPLRWEHKTDELEVIIDSSNDLCVLKSPYKSKGTYCSPCFPGGVSLGTDGDVECLALPTDWFDEYNECPYELI